jgi:hypothetical protein
MNAKRVSAALIPLLLALIVPTQVNAQEAIYAPPIALTPCGANQISDCITKVEVIDSGGNATSATPSESERGLKHFAIWDGMGTKSAELPTAKFQWDLPGINHAGSGSKTFIDVQVAKDPWGSVTSREERAMAPVIRVRVTPAIIDKRCLILRQASSAYSEDQVLRDPNENWPTGSAFPCETPGTPNVPADRIGKTLDGNGIMFLPNSLDPKLHLRITFKVTDFDPLGWFGHSGNGSSAEISVSGDESTITLDLYAIRVAQGKQVIDIAKNRYVEPQIATQDPYVIDAYAPINTLKECFSGKLAIFTNSRTLNLPVFDPINRIIELATAAPHFLSDGKTLNEGFYQANIGDYEAKCLWQVDTAAKLAGQAQISIVDQESGEPQVATLSTSLKNNVLSVFGAGFHYSQPTLRLKLSQPAATSTASTDKPAENSAPKNSQPTKVTYSKNVQACIKKFLTPIELKAVLNSPQLPPGLNAAKKSKVKNCIKAGGK